jgi:protein SCO1/2
VKGVALEPLVARGLPVALFCLAAALSFALSPTEPATQRGPHPRQSDRFSDIVLTTQHGEPVRFYDDLVRDRTVIINLMYTQCGETCPTNTAELAKVHRTLGERMGRDITMLSLSIDPARDTPERLKHYWESFGSRPGWLFLTGKPHEIDRLRMELGAYDLDPVIDADPAQHAGFITVGNDKTNRWSALPLQMQAAQLVGSILKISRAELKDGA